MDKQLVVMSVKQSRMCQYFSKAEDQYSQAIKQASKGAFENNLHHHKTMETIARAYLGNRVQFKRQFTTLRQNGT